MYLKCYSVPASRTFFLQPSLSGGIGWIFILTWRIQLAAWKGGTFLSQLWVSGHHQCDQCSYYALKLASFRPFMNVTETVSFAGLGDGFGERISVKKNSSMEPLKESQGTISLTSHLSLHATIASRNSAWLDGWMLQAWVIEKPATQARTGQARDVVSVYHLNDQKRAFYYSI